MVGALGINSDIYQNTLLEVKRQIAMHLELNNNDAELIAIYRYLKESKVNINAFDFIASSRSHLWLVEEKISGLVQQINPQKFLISKFETKEKFIYFIDQWIQNLGEKELFISNAANDIARIAREMKYLKWFDDDVKKVVAADHFFRRTYPDRGAYPFFEKFDNVEDIRILFYANRFNLAQRKLDFNSIQSQFHNKKAKDNPNKKQFNFSLSIAANKNINKLANDRGITRSAVIDMAFKDMKSWPK